MINIKHIVQILLKTLITIGVFFLLFRSSVWIISNFHTWNSSLQRGIMWELYLQLFSALVLLSNIVIHFITNKGLARLLVNIIILLLLVLFFFSAIRTAPYSIFLPHLISLIVLLVLPFILRKNRLYKRLNE